MKEKRKGGGRKKKEKKKNSLRSLESTKPQQREILPHHLMFPANIPKLYRLDLYQRRRIHHRFSLTLPVPGVHEINYIAMLVSKTCGDFRFLFAVPSPRPHPSVSLIICLSVSVTLHLQSSWGDHCHLVWRGSSVITRASYFGAHSDLSNPFDLNCLHNHFKKSS